MKKTRKVSSYTYLIIILVAISVFASIFAYVNAYFTSTVNIKGDLTFHDINLEINLTNKNSSLFSSTISTVLPGNTIYLTNIKVSNTGSANMYSLINFSVTVLRPGYSEYKMSKWYNLSKQEITSLDDMTANNVGATNLASGTSSDVLNFEYEFKGNIFDNSFKNATVNVQVKAVGIQTENLPTIDGVELEPLRASYMLINDNYSYELKDNINYEDFENYNTLICNTPNTEEGQYKIYNIYVKNISESDTLHIYVKDVDSAFICSGKYGMDDVLADYLLGTYPDGAIYGDETCYSSFDINAENINEFTIFVEAQTKVDPTILFYIEPTEDLPGYVA